MLDIDIISNYPSHYIPTFKSNSNLYPLFAFREQLRERGFRCNLFLIGKENERSSAQIAFVDSRVFSSDNAILPESDLEKLHALRKKYDLLIWLDTRDSTGTTNFEVLPFVDKYCKKSILRDKNLYKTQFRGCRIYTDYYCSKYDVPDCDKHLDSYPLPDNHEKLTLGWNLVYSDFNSSNRISRYINILRERWSPQNLKEVGEKRTVDLQARFTDGYGSAAISFHRRAYKQIAQQLIEKDFVVKTGRIAKKDYLDELSETHAVLSPFGWGEICFRDFEAFQSGCALIKPDCQHLETWPDLFVENKTYLPLPWEPEAAHLRLIAVLENSELILSVAEQGQKAFKNVWSDEGIQHFCDHFSKLVGN